MTSHELFETLDHAGDDVFVTNKAGRIVHWNPSARTTLGVRGAIWSQRPCWEVVGCGAYSPNCRFMTEARELKPAAPCELKLHTKDGEEWYSVLHVGANVADHSDSLVIHLCRNIDREKRLRDATSRCVRSLREIADLTSLAEKNPVSLTAREVEVLGLCAKGQSSGQIADALGIAETTVRNHVQNVLKKLKCHTRVEAILRARESGQV